MLRATAAETESHSRAESEKTARQEADKASKEAVANMVTALKAIDQMLTRVAQQLADTPQMELMRQGLLEDALWFYQGLLEQKSTDPGLRLETGKALTRVGFIYYYMDRRTDAIRACANRSPCSRHWSRSIRPNPVTGPHWSKAASPGAMRSGSPAIDLRRQKLSCGVRWSLWTAKSQSTGASWRAFC